MTKKNEKKSQEVQSSVSALPSIKNLPIWVVVLVFLATTIFFFKSIIFGDAYFWEDIVRFVYPLQNFAAKEGAAGNIPFWNPFTFTGMPFLADLQVGFWYPFNRILSLFIGDGGNLSFAALQLMIISHFFISQLNTYFLARYFKISSIGSIIAAISFSFSLLMICHSIHPMIVQHLSWFPLVLLLFIKGVKDKDIKSGILAGLIYGISMLSGHTQMSLYEGLILLFVFLWYLFTSVKATENRTKSINKTIISAALTICIAIGIFFVQYLPSSKYVDVSKRNAATYEFVTEGSLTVSQGITAFIPKFFGYRNGQNDVSIPYHLPGAMGHIYWETSFYFGIGIVFLALFAFIALFKENHIKLLIFLSAFAFLFALGSNGFIFDIFYHLPFFGLFRMPARMLFIFNLSFALAAGFGIDQIYKGFNDKKVSKYLFIALSIMLGISFLGAFGAFTSILSTPEEVKSLVNEQGLLALGIIIVIGFLAVFASKVKTNQNLIGGIIALVIFFDLYSAGADFNKIDTNPNTFYSSLFTQAPSLRDTLTPKYPNDVFRVNMRLYGPKGQTLAKPMEDDQGMLDYIMLLEGYNPLILNRMNPPIANQELVKDMKNVKYALGVDSASQTLGFINRPTRFGNAWLVYNYKQVTTSELEEAAKNNNFALTNNFDFKNNVIVEKKLNNNYSGKASDSVAHSIKVQQYNYDMMIYKVNTEEPAVMVFSEIYYPDWKVYIDDKPTEMFPANFSFRAAEIPAGTHTITMKYESSEFKAGATVSIITFIVAISAFFGLYYFEKKKK